VGSDSNAAAPWIDITDANVVLRDVEKYHGGVNGALVTVGFHLTIDDATRLRLVGSAGTNTVQFRFNGTDGNSNGYRILDLQFQDDAGKNLSPATKTWADVSVEKMAGKDATADAQKGLALWTGRNLLVKSPIVHRSIRAACNDCHAADGRDLQYFNYSNNSIVQRSRFHGLSEEQGRQIAAYLRSSLYSKVPHVAAAAPWNPPYQPGPGLDAKPAVEWAAGAGIDAVLPDGKAAIKAYLGKPVDDKPLSIVQADLDAAMSPNGMLNAREMAIPLELPDWNAWLPIVHPLDIWTPDSGKATGLFETGYQGQDPLGSYAALVKWLEANKNPNGVYEDWSHLTPSLRQQLQGLLTRLGAQTLAFGGGGRGSRISPDPQNPYGVQIGGQKLQAGLASSTAALANLNACGPVGPCTPFSTEAFIERADIGLYHWMGVKQWELVEKYGLHDPRSFHGTIDASGNWVGQGDRRGFPYTWPSVFYIAPHMLYVPTQTPQGLRELYFSWENRLVSYYRTDAWYALQVTISPGWAGSSNTNTIDWPYTQGFITRTADDLIAAKAPRPIAAAHLIRYFEINTKLSQVVTSNIPFDSPDPKDPTNINKNAGMNSRADELFKLVPSNVFDQHANQPSRFRLLEDLAPGAYVQFVNAMISAYGTLFFATSRSQYRICDPNNMQLGGPEQYAGQRFCSDASRTPLPIDGQGQPYCPPPSNDGYTTEQYSVWGVIAATKLGADAGRVKNWSDWNDRMWPK
jgi:cytochrome c553